MNPHKIRLAGPWEWQRAGASGDQRSESRVTCQLPFEVTEECAENLSLSLFRRFHCPTGLELTTTVAVCLEIENAVPQIWLNGEVYAAERVALLSPGNSASVTWRCDVTNRLKSFNELQIVIPANPEPSPLKPRLMSVQLEISE
jgi:hypothetical protein